MIVLLVGLGISHDAQAAGKVDWSEYLEPPGSRTPVRTAASERSTKVSAKKQKASRSKAKKKQTAASRSKAKKTVRSKRRR